MSKKHKAKWWDDTPDYHKDLDHPTKASPPGPPLDPAVLAEFIDHRVGWPEGNTFTKPITYVLTGSGLLRVKQNAIGMSVAAVTKEKVPGLVPSPVTPGFTLTVPKVPWPLFQQVVAFFRAVNAKETGGCEAYAQVWWTPEGAYVVKVPPQRVSAGHVSHDGWQAPTGWVHMADIHSHGNTSAFFSSTDDGDEARADRAERIYGVIGELTFGVPAMKWRARVGREFVDLAFTDVVEVGQTEPMTFRLDLHQILEYGTGKAEGVALSLGLDPYEGVTYPEAWMQAVTIGGTFIWTGVGDGGVDPARPWLPRTSLPASTLPATSSRIYGTKIWWEGNLWGVAEGHLVHETTGETIHDWATRLGKGEALRVFLGMTESRLLTH